MTISLTQFGRLPVDQGWCTGCDSPFRLRTTTRSRLRGCKCIWKREYWFNGSRDWTTSGNDRGYQQVWPSLEVELVAWS